MLIRRFGFYYVDEDTWKTESFQKQYEKFPEWKKKRLKIANWYRKKYPYPNKPKEVYEFIFRN